MKCSYAHFSSILKKPDQIEFDQIRNRSKTQVHLTEWNVQWKEIDDGVSKSVQCCMFSFFPRLDRINLSLHTKTYNDHLSFSNLLFWSFCTDVASMNAKRSIIEYNMIFYLEECAGKTHERNFLSSLNSSFLWYRCHVRTVLLLFVIVEEKLILFWSKSSCVQMSLRIFSKYSSLRVIYSLCFVSHFTFDMRFV